MRHTPLTPLLIPVLAAWLAAAGPAAAQYKVVQPDGSVTYTDRPPAAGNARVTPMARNTAQQNAQLDLSLPLELRQPVARYPVTLYTTADCAPCDAGRRLLQTRGVPYSERRISTEEDAAALERAVGGRSVPALNIGPQPVRGFSEGDWQVFLDSAGYPRESRLPRNWPVPVPQPLVERAPPRPATPAPAPAPAAANDMDTAPASGIRF